MDTGQKTANPRQGIKTVTSKLLDHLRHDSSQKTANPRQGIKTTSGIKSGQPAAEVWSEDSESSPGD